MTFEPRRTRRLTPTRKVGPVSFTKVRVIALVARDRLVESRSADRSFNDTKHGFAPYFEAALRAIEKEVKTLRKTVDLVVFSLWSHSDAKSGKLRWLDTFPKGTTHRAVLVEIEDQVAELRIRDRRRVYELHQKFGSSRQVKRKREFVETEMQSRIFGDLLVLLCGESNVISIKRKSNQIEDQFGALNRIATLGVDVIVNPIHNYMVRYEMKLKRSALSKRGRVVLSVWNRGARKKGHEANESPSPWTAFANRRDVSKSLEEIPHPVAEQPGVRIALLDIDEIRK